MVPYMGTRISQVLLELWFLRWGKYSAGPNVITRVVVNPRGRQASQSQRAEVWWWEQRSDWQDVRRTQHVLAGFADGGLGPQAREGGWCSGARQVKHMDSFPQCPEGTQPCWRLDLNPLRPCRTSDLWNCKINVCHFKTLSSWRCVTATIGN